jgi:NADPH:quinone reductase-like Zn-dependent oxidoreductase
MKAIVYERYGGPEVLELREVDKPEVPDDGVLVRVRASSVNPVDWHMMTGTPYIIHLLAGLRGPRDPRTGSDFAGTVEAIGKDVTHVRPGDDVFGIGPGSFAEYVCVREAVAPMPANATFEQAGAVGVAAITALQGLRDKGGLQAGQKVLINGASGGVGTFAVQIAKAMGAEVTGVCSTQKVELVGSLGADRVVDYTRDDFTRNGERYDLLLDVAGNRRLSESKRVLAPDGTYVWVGAPKEKKGVLGPARRLLTTRVRAIGSSRTLKVLIAKPNRDDMLALRDLIEAGKVTPVIDRTYELPQIGEAMAYLGEWHACGKIVVTVPS